VRGLTVGGGGYAVKPPRPRYDEVFDVPLVIPWGADRVLMSAEEQARRDEEQELLDRLAMQVLSRLVALPFAMTRYYAPQAAWLLSSP
jgi:hypothetical protein